MIRPFLLRHNRHSLQEEKKQIEIKKITRYMLEEKHGEKCVNPISMCQHEEKFRRDANELKIPQPQVDGNTECVCIFLPRLIL
jgi:hypothetical protein